MQDTVILCYMRMLFDFRRVTETITNIFVNKHVQKQHGLGLESRPAYRKSYSNTFCMRAKFDNEKRRHATSNHRS